MSRARVVEKSIHALCNLARNAVMSFHLRLRMMKVSAYFASVRHRKETRGFIMSEVPYGRHSLLSFLFVLVWSKIDRSGLGAVRDTCHLASAIVAGYLKI